MKNKAFASLEKALDILALFEFDHPLFTVQEISERLNIPLSTTYKYVDVFLKRGLFVKKAGSKEIGLGLSIFRLGSIFTANFGLIETAAPHMKSLMKQSGETILLTAIEGWNALCLERMEPNRLIKLSMERGRRLPLNAGASSRILLAYQDDAFINAFVEQSGLHKLAKNTITKASKLRTELKRIREHGFAVSDSEVDAGAKAVSAPIFDCKGQLIAGLTIAGPSQRIHKDLLSDLILMVKKRAAQISRDFGYTNE